jgi:hypothetical protein
MTETDPSTHEDRQHVLQQVLLSLKHLQGTPPSEVQPQLERALAEAGLPDQPAPWLRDTSAELSAGRLIVVSPREIPDEVEHLEPDPEQHAAG